MEKKNSTNVWMLILGGILLAELVLGIITIQYKFLDIIALVPMVFTILYAFWLYKWPHGNMLKYAMLLFALERIIESIGCIKEGWDVCYNQTAKILASAIIIYVAGRLDHINQNKVLLSMAFVLILEGVVVAVITFAQQYPLVYVISWFGEPVLILTIMVSYFGRYKDHKKAGLQTTPGE